MEFSLVTGFLLGITQISNEPGDGVSYLALAKVLSCFEFLRLNVQIRFLYLPVVEFFFCYFLRVSHPIRKQIKKNHLPVNIYFLFVLQIKKIYPPVDIKSSPTLQIKDFYLPVDKSFLSILSPEYNVASWTAKNAFRSRLFP